jgi:hypothetical protein
MIRSRNRADRCVGNGCRSREGTVNGEGLLESSRANKKDEFSIRT